MAGVSLRGDPWSRHAQVPSLRDLVASSLLVTASCPCKMLPKWCGLEVHLGMIRSRRGQAPEAGGEHPDTFYNQPCDYPHLSFFESMLQIALLLCTQWRTTMN